MSNSFDPNAGGVISRSEAEAWIRNYDEENREDKERDTISVFFGRDFLRKVIETKDAAGVTFFFVKKPNTDAGKNLMDLVLVPRTADGQLLWPTLFDGKDASDQGAYDKSVPCPPGC
jgi:hypothetical protein